ncbi:GNAT family N-acetyltransferase [Paenibacillus sp. N1-5-1-14]|uniref:GNAT family N-acetyltransferase n=1 Tax=Paenibacillus radicibacter TaxID=2972488 RepID=UPI002158F9D3|nr:GNAT family N-acetyltransferase [Paenibacillus radicibacter]MCR8641084.1 GNAT family N-acetyltransferase [Paenibacillus radicibacter]
MNSEQLIQMVPNPSINTTIVDDLYKNDVFFSDGWATFNEVKWGVTSKRINLVGYDTDQPSMHAMLFLNKEGRIVRPPMNPYLPIQFKGTSTSNVFRLNSQWLSLCKPLLQEFSQHQFSNTIFLPPHIQDIRPWQWAGLRTSVRYTYIIEFPYHIQQADATVRQKIKKAHKNGYIMERSTNMEHVFACLEETEAHQNFKHQITLEDLKLAYSLLGDKHFLAYVAYAPNGEPASAEIILYTPDGFGYGWACGNKREHLKYGTQFALTSYAIDDLKAMGAKGLDMCGANIPSVAQTKMSWGTPIAPYYTVDNFSIQTLTKWSRDWFRYARQKGREK